MTPKRKQQTLSTEQTHDDLSGKEHPSLKQEVKQALLNAMRDPSAPAAAKVSAARALLEHFSDHESANHSDKRGAELTAAELDREIERLAKRWTAAELDREIERLKR